MILLFILNAFFFCLIIADVRRKLMLVTLGTYRVKWTFLPALSIGQHYLLASSVDCEQSLFFFRFNEGSARARERRAAKPRDARNDGGARSYLRLSCVLLDGPRKKRDCSQSSLRCGGWFWFRTVQRRLSGYHSTVEKGSEIYIS